MIMFAIEVNPFLLLFNYSLFLLDRVIVLISDMLDNYTDDHPRLKMEGNIIYHAFLSSVYYPIISGGLMNGG